MTYINDMKVFKMDITISHQFEEGYWFMLEQCKFCFLLFVIKHVLVTEQERKRKRFCLVSSLSKDSCFTMSTAMHTYTRQKQYYTLASLISTYSRTIYRQLYNTHKWKYIALSYDRVVSALIHHLLQGWYKHSDGLDTGVHDDGRYQFMQDNRPNICALHMHWLHMQNIIDIRISDCLCHWAPVPNSRLAYSL